MTTLTVRAGAHNLKNSARETGVQNFGVKLVVKHKDFTMETLVKKTQKIRNFSFSNMYLLVFFSIVTLLY